MVQLHASNFSIPQQFVACSKARQQQCAINSTNIDTFGENDRDKQSLEPSQSKPKWTAGSTDWSDAAGLVAEGPRWPKLIVLHKLALLAVISNDLLY